MNTNIITQNILKVNKNEVKSSFLDRFNCLPKGSLIMLYAGAFTGKSSLMIALSKEIVANHSQISCYHIDGDNSRKTAAERGVCEIEEAFDNYHYLCVADKPKIERFEILRQFSQCEPNELKNTLIIIDSIKDFCVGDMAKDKDADTFMEVIKILVSKGATAVLLHHQTKQVEGHNNKAYKGSTIFFDSCDDCYFMSSIKKDGQLIAMLESMKGRSAIKDCNFTIHKKTHDIQKLSKNELGFEFLSEKERYTIEIAREIIENRSKISQSELAEAIRKISENAGVDIVGNNKKWKLFEKFDGKFWRIDNSKSVTAKVFYPIFSKNYELAKEKKEQYLQKLIEMKADGKLPISLSKFGKLVRPHLNAREIEKLLSDDVWLDSNCEVIVDVKEK